MQTLPASRKRRQAQRMSSGCEEYACDKGTCRHLAKATDPLAADAPRRLALVLVLWSSMLVEQKLETRHCQSIRPCIVSPSSGRRPCLFSPREYCYTTINRRYIQFMRTLRASRSVLSSTKSKAPCICFSRVLRRSCMKLDFIRPLRACSLPTASAYRCDCLLSSACYFCAQPRIDDAVSRPTKGASTMQPSSRYSIPPLVFTAMSPSIACSCSFVALSFAPTITLHPY